MVLKFRPKKEQVRIIYTDAPGYAFEEHKRKVFAVIGPFNGHLDKPELKRAIEMVLRGWNVEGD
jgi:hypothetical protein